MWVVEIPPRFALEGRRLFLVAIVDLDLYRGLITRYYSKRAAFYVKTLSHASACPDLATQVFAPFLGVKVA
jgi:hypothetical protein